MYRLAVTPVLRIAALCLWTMATATGAAGQPLRPMVEVSVEDREDSLIFRWEIATSRRIRSGCLRSRSKTDWPADSPS